MSCAHFRFETAVCTDSYARALDLAKAESGVSCTDNEMMNRPITESEDGDGMLLL